jgi:hypothetical protein
MPSSGGRKVNQAIVVGNVELHFPPKGWLKQGTRLMGISSERVKQQGHSRTAGFYKYSICPQSCKLPALFLCYHQYFEAGDR